MRTRAKSRSTGPADWFAPATKTVMKAAAEATDPTLYETKSTAGKLSPRAEPCPAAGDGESAARYLFNLSRDVILSLDRTGNILCINQRGVQLSGYSESELRGANILQRLLLPEDRPAIGQSLDDLVRGKARQYEVRWRTKGGAVVHFDGVSVPRLS